MRLMQGCSTLEMKAWASAADIVSCVSPVCVEVAFDKRLAAESVAVHDEAGSRAGSDASDVPQRSCAHNIRVGNRMPNTLFSITSMRSTTGSRGLSHLIERGEEE
jgi:hypothetical protein